MLAAVCGLVGWLAYYFNPTVSAKRESEKRLEAWARDLLGARAWIRLCDAESSDPTLHVAQVTECYGVYTRRGTKAWITWRELQYVKGGSYLDTAVVPMYRQDTWFEKLFPAQGSWVLLRGRSGYGPHNNNPRVFFVNAWLDVAPPDAPNAWARCQAANWTPPAVLS